MPLRPEDELNLPDAPDFISRPPVYTAGEMARMCEAMLPHWNRARFAAPPPPVTGPPFRLYPEDWAERE